MVYGYRGSSEVWSRTSAYKSCVRSGPAYERPLPIIKRHKEGGRLIVPLGSTVYFQTLTFATKRNDYSKIKQLSPVAFVPLVGEMQKERGIISREIAWVSVRI